MRIRSMSRAGIVPAIGLGLALSLTACGGSDEAGSSSTDTSTPAEAESSAPASESAAAAPAADEKEVKIGKTLKDPQMGDTIEIVSAIRDFPSTEQADAISNGGEVVLLQVKVKPGKKFGGRVGDDAFQLTAGDVDITSTTLLKDEMEAAKRTPFDDIARSDGGEATGWIGFKIIKKADTYTVTYTRDAAKVMNSDSDKPIPEFKQEIEIPAS